MATKVWVFLIKTNQLGEIAATNNTNFHQLFVKKCIIRGLLFTFCRAGINPRSCIPVSEYAPFQRNAFRL